MQEGKRWTANEGLRRAPTRRTKMAKVGPKMAKVGPKMAKDGPKVATVGHLGRPAVRRSEISTYVTVSMLFRPRWPRWPPLPPPWPWAIPAGQVQERSSNRGEGEGTKARGPRGRGPRGRFTNPLLQQKYQGTKGTRNGTDDSRKSLCTKEQGLIELGMPMSVTERALVFP